jgi:hypothetical protein
MAPSARVRRGKDGRGREGRIIVPVEKGGDYIRIEEVCAIRRPGACGRGGTDAGRLTPTSCWLMAMLQRGRDPLRGKVA